jgi:hypothetical protein
MSCTIFFSWINLSKIIKTILKILVVQEKIFLIPSMDAFCVELSCSNYRQPHLRHCLDCIRQKKLVILDLDETLCCARKFPLQTSLPFTCPKNMFYVYERPHVREFLKFVFEHFTVGFWSAGSPLYVQDVLSYLLAPNQIPEFIFTSEHCLFPEPENKDSIRTAVKPLRIIAPCLDNIVHIDDQQNVFRENWVNGILIASFDDPCFQEKDQELIRIMHVLKYIFLR